MRIARRLALGRLISLTGGSAAYIALIAAVYDQTGSAAWVSAALFAGVVGTVLAAPFAGWLGDHYDRRAVMVAADLAAAAVATAMALTGEPAALVVLLGLSAVAQSPFEPASAAAIPNLVAPSDVARANSLVAATGSAGYLVGPLLGGVVLGLSASPATLFAVDAATFVVSAILVASVRTPFGRGATAEHPGVLAGARVILDERSLRLVVGAGMASLVGIGIVHVAAYPLSTELDAGTEGYGAMTALVGGRRRARRDPRRPGAPGRSRARPGRRVRHAGRRPRDRGRRSGDRGCARWPGARRRRRRHGRRRDDDVDAEPLARRGPQPRLRGAGRRGPRGLHRGSSRRRPDRRAGERARSVRVRGGLRSRRRPDRRAAFHSGKGCGKPLGGDELGSRPHHAGEAWNRRDRVPPGAPLDVCLEPRRPVGACVDSVDRPREAVGDHAGCDRCVGRRRAVEPPHDPACAVGVVDRERVLEPGAEDDGFQAARADGVGDRAEIEQAAEQDLVAPRHRLEDRPRAVGGRENRRGRLRFQEFPR